MPIFMDVHENLPQGATANDVAHAHEADLAKQDAYGVKYLKYWVDEKQHKAFCLVDAPNADLRGGGRRLAFRHSDTDGRSAEIRTDV